MLKVATVPTHGCVRDVSQPIGPYPVVRLGSTYTDGAADPRPRGHLAVSA